MTKAFQIALIEKIDFLTEGLSEFFSSIYLQFIYFAIQKATIMQKLELIVYHGYKNYEFGIGIKELFQNWTRS